jgi:CheY-like chemotaxis protein
LDKILLIEDVRTLSKLISRKLSQDLDTKVDVAFTFKEAQDFVSKHNYFVVLSDLILPDGPNGEVIEVPMGAAGVDAATYDAATIGEGTPEITEAEGVVTREAEAERMREVEAPKKADDSFTVGCFSGSARRELCDV